MNRLSMAVLCTVLTFTVSPALAQSETVLNASLGTDRLNMSVRPDGVRYAMACINSGELKSVTNKICYYDCLGDLVAITIKKHKMCPPRVQWGKDDYSKYSN